ncbi:transporter substrate-binding domain-containing protein [Psychromonas sp.]|uniref:transporter substrate-binding domain-containing diguanylate cyclase n=1 Tax=Psychromonas sp. TaxID=1884585 RepID=UPI0039E647A4
MIPSLLFLRKLFMLVFTFIAICGALSVSAQQITFNPQELLYLKENSTIKVAGEKAWPPFNFIEDKKVKGYCNDLVRLVAQNIGLKIEFVTGYDRSDYVAMLAKGDIDLIPNMKITPEREKSAIFTQYKPLNAVNGLLTLNKTADYANFSYLKNKTVALVRGFFYEELMRSHYPEINLLLTNSTEESVEQLALGNADAVLDSYAVINYYIQRNFISGVKNTPLFTHPIFNYPPLYMGLNKNNSVLRDILNKGLLAISDNELSQLQKNWSSSTQQTNQFTDTNFQEKMPIFRENERLYLQHKGDLRICVDPDWLPIEGLKKGEYVGMGADFVRLFSQRIGNVIKLVKTDSWTETLDFAKQGKCDVIPLINKTEERQRYLSFSFPYLRFPLALVTKKDRLIAKIDEVLDKPLGIVKDYAYKDFFENKTPHANLREFSSAKLGLAAVESGEIYGFIDLLPVMAQQIKSTYPELKIADKFDHKYSLSLAVTGGDTLLLAILNKVVASISVQQHDQIVNRWLPLVYEKESDLTWLWYLLAAVIFIFCVFTIYSASLLKANRKLTKVQAKLEQLAMRDTLTGLANQKYFIDSLNNEWLRAKRSKLPLSVVILDIDHFKKFNELHGRYAGDDCLVEFARRLQQLITRPADLVARYDGEEFALILPETDEDGVKVIAADIFYLLQQWALTDDRIASATPFTISAGCATLFFNDRYKADELTRRAYNGLFQAQHNGYNQYVLYGHYSQTT